MTDADLKTPTRTWTRVVDNKTYTCSTDTALIQLDAINAAFASDIIYWAKPLPRTELYKIVQNSLCFGIYVQDDTSLSSSGGYLPFPSPSYYNVEVNRRERKQKTQ